MDMSEKTETLMSVIERLSGLLVDENECMTTREFSQIADTIEEKNKLCKAFELLVRGLSKDLQGNHTINDDTRELLLESGTELNDLVTKNASTLKSNIESNERLMLAVRKAAIECTPKANNYTYGGQMSMGSRIDTKAPPPVSVNQVL